MRTIAGIGVRQARRPARVILGLSILVVLALPGALFAQGGVAATAHPLATEAALQMLGQGGNAVDAAVAAAFAIGVVEPDGSGLGGGGGMLIHLRDLDRTLYVNYYQESEGDPGAVSFDPATDRNTPRAVLVPGTVAGLCRALADYGTLPLATVIAPAITFAEEGFPLDATLAGIVLDNLESLMRNPGLAGIFMKDGFPLMEGETLRQPELAEVLRAIAAEGRDGFYRGRFAADLVAALQADGGAMTLEDLARYEPEISAPVRGTYRGLEIVSAPPPHAGVSLIEIMNMVELVRLDPDVHFTESARTMHLLAEIFRRAYADRSQSVGDPRFTDIPVAGLVAKGYARERFTEINPYRAEPRNYRDTPAGNPYRYASGSGSGAVDPGPVPAAGSSGIHWGDERDDDPRPLNRFQDDPFDRWRKPETQPVVPGRARGDSSRPGRRWSDDDEFDGGHTTHLSVIDGRGNMVSLTQTLGNFFGSKVVVDGVILNNGRSNFSRVSPTNMIEPYKRPRSSITPTLVFRDGNPFMSLGSPGAGRIIASVAQVLINVIDYGMDVQAANDAPRFFCQKFEDYFFVESRIGEEVRKELGNMGHQVRALGDMDLFFGGVQVAAIDPAKGGFVGSADPRRGGVSRAVQERIFEADGN